MKQTPGFRATNVVYAYGSQDPVFAILDSSSRSGEVWPSVSRLRGLVKVKITVIRMRLLSRSAEAVAEITKRPLYVASAGELGVEPSDVDARLQRILELANKWDAVLLLDEADVFLQPRNSTDVRRNALVSIFLRQLEYYQGILILTTNRISDCDPAFESRIRMTLKYPELDQAARKEIWATFLERAKGSSNDLEVDVGADELTELAKIQVNGRQVS